jgi:hypothetical protein
MKTKQVVIGQYYTHKKSGEKVLIKERRPGCWFMAWERDGQEPFLVAARELE